MNNLSLTMPELLHRYLTRAAAAAGIPIHQFVILAIAEKVSARETREALSEHARSKPERLHE